MLLRTRHSGLRCCHPHLPACPPPAALQRVLARARGCDGAGGVPPWAGLHSQRHAPVHTQPGGRPGPHRCGPPLSKGAAQLTACMVLPSLLLPLLHCINQPAKARPRSIATHAAPYSLPGSAGLPAVPAGGAPGGHAAGAQLLPAVGCGAGGDGGRHQVGAGEGKGRGAPPGRGRSSVGCVLRPAGLEPTQCPLSSQPGGTHTVFLAPSSGC